MAHRVAGETYASLSVLLRALLIDLTSYLTKEEFLGKVSPAFKPFTDERTTKVELLFHFLWMWSAFIGYWVKGTYGKNGKSLAALIWVFINNQTNKEVVKSIVCISE